MTTEYHDNIDEDSSSFWNKEPSISPRSRVSRLSRRLFPILTVAAILILMIALGASYSKMASRLSSAERGFSNFSQSLSGIQQLAADAAKDVERLKFVVSNNKQELQTTSEALKQLATLNTISRTVATLRCSLDRLLNNGSTSASATCCPLDWVSFSSSCYHFSRSLKSWHDARDWCNGHESHLAIILTDEEWDFVHDHAAGRFYWVGLTDERGSWEWVNQTPYVMNRRRWRPGQPDSWTHHGMGPGDEDCAHVHSDGRLNDLHCSSRLPFICQKHA
ncbi:asialoglycoprotein receptor 1 [Corythoichthys intestinalis]|uniref:asialoglycoprotein receptor 1 n=1 Tax=Corythoichthys intestinalis TaxID=161448 RepID=UPI0025A55456|nr:asialoglycoprotein receptor 1 [Corythoichthys intestinalis]XP_061810660.1 asialoglycoprotein receptor 1-like [Nerophis lumbriciformis]